MVFLDDTMTFQAPVLKGFVSGKRVKSDVSIVVRPRKGCRHDQKIEFLRLANQTLSGCRFSLPTGK